MKIVLDHWVAVLLFLVQTCGVCAALHAVMRVRTSQGAIAWSVFLVSFPWVALPAYLVLGRNKFSGYIEALREARQSNRASMAEIVETLRSTYHSHAAPLDRALSPFNALADLPFTDGNAAQLLIDGEQTFDALFSAIERAEQYVLVQFYIIRRDELGIRFQKALIDKACQGVKVYLLYDWIGCFHLPGEYLEELRAAGVKVGEFSSGDKRPLRFQTNFRNHRKICVVDGQEAFLGGLNVGDEYLGKSRRFKFWRDTHLRLRGPVVQSVQATFAADWYWVAGELPELRWEAQPVASPGMRAFSLATGPADDTEKCLLFFLQCINSAQKRLWITSPYFVPTHSIISALQLAALRGVDVRILLPRKPDHLIVFLASFAYLPLATVSGVTFYRYQKGFLHQKVILVDDELAGVGTANLDNRSLRLNFEVTALVADRAFAGEVERMLEQDFSDSRIVHGDEYHRRSLPFRLAVRLARLFAPVL